MPSGVYVRTIETKRKASEARKGKYLKENNHFWMGGKIRWKKYLG